MPKYYFQIEIEDIRYPQKGREHSYAEDFLAQLFHHRQMAYLETKLSCMANRMPHNKEYPHTKNCEWCKEYQKDIDRLETFLGSNFKKKVKFLKKKS